MVFYWSAQVLIFNCCFTDKGLLQLQDCLYLIIWIFLWAAEQAEDTCSYVTNRIMLWWEHSLDNAHFCWLKNNLLLCDWQWLLFIYWIQAGHTSVWFEVGPGHLHMSLPICMTLVLYEPDLEVKVLLKISSHSWSWLGSTVKDIHGPDRVCSEGGHENDQNIFPI